MIRFEAKLPHVSKSDARNLAKRDAKAGNLASDVDKYVKENSELYYVTVNAWVAYTAETLSLEAGRSLYYLIQNHGFLETVKAGATTADMIIQLPDPVEFSIPSVSGLHDCRQGWLMLLKDHIDGTLDVIIRVLRVLRFAKRFSPEGCDIVARDTERNFCKLQQELKVRQHVEHPAWLVSLVRQEINKMFDGVEPREGSPTTFMYPADIFAKGYIPSGATADYRREEMFGKADAVLEYTGYVRDIFYPYGHPITNLPPSRVDGVCVPKNYKTARLIAEEFTTRQVYFHGLREWLLPTLERNLPVEEFHLRDQSWNANAIGNERYATIDLSSASDTITVTTFKELFPNWFSSTLVENYRARSMRIGGKDITLQTVFTSGNGFTFCCETIVFLAIARAATHLVERIVHVDLLHPMAYGDDIIIDVAAYDTCLDFLSMLDFRPNMDKSFGSGHAFRESCGAEGIWHNGIFVPFDTIYLMRNPLFDKGECTSDAVIRECDLQRRMYAAGYSLVATVLMEDVLQREPRVNLIDPRAEEAYLTEGAPTVYQTLAGLPLAEEKRWPTENPCSEAARYTLFRYVKVPPKGAIAPSPVLSEYTRYVAYLEYGPMYACPLDELLGVSTRRRAPWEIPTESVGRLTTV